MELIDVYWSPSVNWMWVRCDCGELINHPTNISLVECKCGRKELWHSVDPTPETGTWSEPVMKQIKKEKMNEHIIPSLENSENKVLPFQLLPGGKGPEDGNWLARMPSGTAFLCSPVGDQSFMLKEFMHCGMKRGAVLLLDEAAPPGNQWLWVRPDRFSRKFEWYDNIEDKPEEPDDE